MNNDKPVGRRKRQQAAILVLIPVLFVVWAFVVGLSGADVNWTGVEWNFERTAQLGDSFGVIGAIMATAAAVFTFSTLQTERTEIERLRAREDQRDIGDRKREAEATFFQLLNLRNAVLENVKLHLSPGDIPMHGKLAVEQIVASIEMRGEKGKSRQTAYDYYWPTVEGEVGHYLRSTYHIIKFSESEFDKKSDKYRYISLLRAQLSNAELELIALNSMYGAGKPLMAEFIECYSFLHPLPDNRIDDLNLRDGFTVRAFDSSIAKRELGIS